MINGRPVGEVKAGRNCFLPKQNCNRFVRKKSLTGSIVRPGLIFQTDSKFCLQSKPLMPSLAVFPRILLDSAQMRE